MATAKRTKVAKDEIDPRAVGDSAVAAGMALVASTALVSLGDDDENQTRDYIANYAKRTGPLIDIWVQASAPAHKAGRVWIKTT
jgi:hypothetical protein